MKNYDTIAIDLGGWIIGDKNDPDAYRIPNGNVIEAGESLEFRRSRLGFGINNSGETIFLWHPAGDLVDTWRN